MTVSVQDDHAIDGGVSHAGIHGERVSPACHTVTKHLLARLALCATVCLILNELIVCHSRCT